MVDSRWIRVRASGTLGSLPRHAMLPTAGIKISSAVGMTYDPVGLFERAGWPEAEVGEVCQNQVVPAMRRGLATAGNSAAHDPTNRAWLIVACA